MDKDKRLKLLSHLEKNFNEAKKNPEISPYQIRQLYFELQCLRQQLMSMSEEELELNDTV